MRHRSLTLTLAATAAAVLLGGCGSSSGTAASPTTTTPSAGSGTTTPAAGSTAGAGQGSEADISFAQLMIPHHQQAVEMADLALSKAPSPQVKQLAEQIKAAQAPEIATMRGWLTAWGAPEQMQGMTGMTGHDMGGVTGEGMMTDAQMKALATASGQQFDTMWLTMMIAHHEGAIAMANDVLSQTSNPAVTAMAKSIVAGQTKEIETMKGLLAG